YGNLEINDLDWLIAINKKFILPDLTFFLKVSPRICIKRIKRDGKLYHQRYERGVPVTPVRPIQENITGTGTIITFKPDPTIFETTTFDADILAARMRDLAFLNKGIKINMFDERTNKEYKFHYEG
ncbi:MAG: hypothetical protein QXT63_02245, partial [Thermoplasmata archaeon]